MVLAGMAGWGYEATGAPAARPEPAWSFDMWCLEMQLYPEKRCDARLREDLLDYQQYRADVEKYNQQELAGQKRDQDILQRLDQNLPGAPSPANR